MMYFMLIFKCAIELMTCPLYLYRDFRQRPEATELLQHPWISNKLVRVRECMAVSSSVWLRSDYIVQSTGPRQASLGLNSAALTALCTAGALQTEGISQHSE